MPVEKYITSYCLISENMVWKNGAILFKKKEATLHSLLICLYEHLGIAYPKFYKMDNLSKLGWLASEILLNDQNLQNNYRPEEIGIFLSNADSSLDTDLKYFETIKDMPSPALFVYTLPNIMIGEICIRNNFKGENGFFISEAFDADLMEHYISTLFDNDLVQACICGWVELLEEKYKVVLFLVEKEKSKGIGLFTKEKMKEIFMEPGYRSVKL